MTAKGDMIASNAYAPLASVGLSCRSAWFCDLRPVCGAAGGCLPSDGMAAQTAWLSYRTRLFPFIHTNDLSIGQHMAVHCFHQGSAFGVVGEIQRLIQR